jgi:hypothetical protein
MNTQTQVPAPVESAAGKRLTLQSTDPLMNKKDEYNNTCDRCGKTEAGIGWFARAYRLSRIRKGEPDPGNVCGACAGGETGKEIGSRIIEKEKLT